MFGNLITALEITLLGMGLVFATIILLWGVMVLLTRLSAEEKEIPNQSTADMEVTDLPTGYPTKNLKILAAAAGVACALAQSKHVPREFPLPPTAIVSAWQAVARSNMLRRGRVR